MADILRKQDGTVVSIDKSNLENVDLDDFKNESSDPFARDSDIPDKVSDLVNDAGFITSSALSGYATEQWVASQGYLTGVTWTDVTGKPAFATVATSGDYADLLNKPTIPTKVSDLQNDSGFVTDSYSYSKSESDGRYLKQNGFEGDFGYDNVHLNNYFDSIGYDFYINAYTDSTKATRANILLNGVNINNFLTSAFDTPSNAVQLTNYADFGSKIPTNVASTWIVEIYTNHNDGNSYGPTACAIMHFGTDASSTNWEQGNEYVSSPFMAYVNGAFGLFYLFTWKDNRNRFYLANALTPGAGGEITIGSSSYMSLVIKRIK